MSGVELQAELNNKNFHLPIIFLTGHGKVHTAVEAIKRGAIDFLEKPVDNDVLMAKVKTAIKVSVSLSEKAKALSNLTGREKQVLELIERGAPNKAIANRLGISEKTVEFHKKNLAEKIDLFVFRRW